MKKRSGSLFWGGLFVALGTLILLTKYNFIDTGWSFVWSLYPVTLVFIGLLIILKNSMVKPLISALFGAFVATLIFGSVNNVIFGIHVECSDMSDCQSGNYVADFDRDMKFASLHFSGGAGYFEINKTTDKLIEGISYGSFGEYYFKTNESENTAYVKLEQNSKHTSFLNFANDFKNRIEFSLNPEPLWDLDFDFGAAKARYDLSKYRIRDINIDTGVSDIYLKLGDKSPETYLDIKVGASTIEIRIPKESGCRVSGDMVLFSKDFEDFQTMKRNGNKYYVTENYDEAENKIYIIVDGGLTNLDITRY